MTTDEHEVFAKEIESDALLQEQVEQYKLLIEAAETAELQSRMNEFHETIASSAITAESEKGSSGKRIQLYRFAAAAAVILLVGLGVRFWLPQASSSDKLFSQFFEADEGLATPMSAVDTYQFSKAMVSYKSGDYDQAIAGWEALLPESPANDTLNYFIGVSHLANGNTEKAIGLLESASKVTDSAFSSEIFWYLGLAYLKNEESDRAIDYLSKTKHPEKEKLLELLSD